MALEPVHLLKTEDRYYLEDAQRAEKSYQLNKAPNDKSPNY